MYSLDFKNWSFLVCLVAPLDDWVLCRIYNKKGGLEKSPAAVAASGAERKPMVGFNAAVSSPPEQKPVVGAPGLAPAFPDLAAYYDRPSDSMPRLHADSSCSEQVLLPEFACEVQSQPKITEWERTFATDGPVNPTASILDPAGAHLGGDPFLQVTSSCTGAVWQPILDD
ncbi:hypothetical protein GUJ93_ZPchr0013g36788 [Zizania palustris]|uniref:NAC domain-containing protein n=1 Tax=Zizania palustris TaxID=103762 RepID=A0A8J6C0G8_ZIZPA|nr:hypothetical protein GUJ93_ZPchr0013g36788 [Zizania palustris]